MRAQGWGSGVAIHMHKRGTSAELLTLDFQPVTAESVVPVPGSESLVLQPRRHCHLPDLLGESWASSLRVCSVLSTKCVHTHQEQNRPGFRKWRVRSVNWPGGLPSQPQHLVALREPPLQGTTRRAVRASLSLGPPALPLLP